MDGMSFLPSSAQTITLPTDFILESRVLSPFRAGPELSWGATPTEGFHAVDIFISVLSRSPPLIYDCAALSIDDGLRAPSPAAARPWEGVAHGLLRASLSPVRGQPAARVVRVGRSTFCNLDHRSAQPQPTNRKKGHEGLLLVTPQSLQ